MGVLIIKKTFLQGKSALLFLLCFCALSVNGNVLENLKNKYPGCELSIQSIYPDKTQLDLLKSKYQDRIVASFYTYYIKKCDEQESRLFVLSDLIRTQKQFLLIEIFKSKIKKIELLKFLEPNEYKVHNSWLEQLKLRENVDIVSGATLTSKSSVFLVWLARNLNNIIDSNESKR